MSGNRYIWIDYLRSSLTVLVVAHHSVLAYTTFASFDKHVYINSTHPIVDTKKWFGLDVFVNFNDIFFMSLMFLIGGLFLSKSISKKGYISFITDRTYRLFIPFILLGTFFMLISYFPSYYIAHNNTNLIAYIADFFTVQKWPVGPPWFIWVLFLFNLLFVFLNPLIEKANARIILFFDNFQNKPIKLLTLLILITWLLYVPLAYTIGAGTWVGLGPFDFQLSRILLYFGYFMIGVFIGNVDFNNNIFSKSAMTIKKWWLWVLLAFIVFAGLTLIPKQLERLVKENQLKEFNAWMIYYGLYISSCVLSCLAFISTFKNFIVSGKAWWTSLSDNAYLIYLIHYVFVVWIQFFLMCYNIPAFLKALITFICALIFSWSASSLLRRNKFIRRFL